jgi:hypothetical protein
MTITKGKGFAVLAVVGMGALLGLLAACAPRLQAKADRASPQKEFAIASLHYERDWMLAFRFYAETHQGQCPTNFEQAAPLLTEEAMSQTNFTPDQFEITFQGSLNEIPSPDHTIVIRQKEAWRSADGAWERAYGFADGHAEIHRAPDGNFSAWEEKLTYPPKSR